MRRSGHGHDIAATGDLERPFAVRVVDLDLVVGLVGEYEKDAGRPPRVEESDSVAGATKAVEARARRFQPNGGW